MGHKLKCSRIFSTKGLTEISAAFSLPVESYRKHNHKRVTRPKKRKCELFDKLPLISFLALLMLSMSRDDRYQTDGGYNTTSLLERTTGSLSLVPLTDGERSFEL